MISGWTTPIPHLANTRRRLRWAATTTRRRDGKPLKEIQSSKCPKPSPNCAPISSICGGGAKASSRRRVSPSRPSSASSSRVFLARCGSVSRRCLANDPFCTAARRTAGVVARRCHSLLGRQAGGFPIWLGGCGSLGARQGLFAEGYRTRQAMPQIVNIAYRIREVDGRDDEIADVLTELHRLTFFSGASIPQFDGGHWWLAFREATPVAFAGVVPSTHVRNAGYLCRVGVLQRH